MTAALTLTNISKIFDETRAVDNVSLKIEKGQFIGGPRGFKINVKVGEFDPQARHF